MTAPTQTPPRDISPRASASAPDSHGAGRERGDSYRVALEGIKAAVDDALVGYCEHCRMAPCVCPVTS